MSFSEDMRSRDMKPSSKVLTLTEMMADDWIASELGLSTPVKVIYFERVRLANEEPMALEKGYLPYDRFSGILEHDLNIQSLYSVLENEFNSSPEVAEEIIEAVIMNEKEARLLGVTKGSPALLAKRITRDNTGIIIETVQTLYRADRYRMFFIRRRQ
jgi:GntR family transcriptional regulator